MQEIQNNYIQSAVKNKFAYKQKYQKINYELSLEI